MGESLEEAAPSLPFATMRSGTKRQFDRLYRIALSQAEFCSVSLTRISRYPNDYDRAATLLRALRNNGRITHIPEKGLRPVWYRWVTDDVA